METFAELLTINFAIALFIIGASMAREKLRWSFFHICAISIPLYFYLFPIDFYMPICTRCALMNSKEYQMAMGKTIFALGVGGLSGQMSGWGAFYFKDRFSQEPC